MKSIVLMSFLALAVAAGSFYALRPTAVDEPRAPTSSTGSQASDDSSSVVQKQMLHRELPTATHPELDADTEIVHGLRVRKNRNCSVELSYVDAGDGSLIEAYSCTPNQPAEPDEFDQYNDETLAGMAYSDASAAEALGKRLAEDDLESARELMIRSAALNPDNPQAMLWLASAYYGLISVNGEPAVDEMMENYVLARLAEELGTSGAANGIQDQLVRAGFQDKDFLQLEDVVNAGLSTIRDIQLEVTGSSDLSEASP